MQGPNTEDFLFHRGTVIRDTRSMTMMIGHSRSLDVWIATIEIEFSASIEGHASSSPSLMATCR